MSANQQRGQLDRKRKQRLDAETRAGEYRSKESSKRADAARARQAATKTRSASTASSRLREAERREQEAETAGKEASRWQSRAASYAKEEASLETRLLKAVHAEAAATERKRRREQEQAYRRAATDRIALESRVRQAESTVSEVVRQLRSPRPEKLRILILGASADGDLRVGREQKRIRAAVESALHRDLVDLDVRPAATTSDLLDGITKFRPHVLHFSGHSNEDLILFEDEIDAPHYGVRVTAEAFRAALSATDTPPLLVLLNACRSAAQLDDLVGTAIPFAIGMSDDIDDGDAIGYAAQFYASVANGQSIHAAHLAGRAALQLAGLVGADLPTLCWAPDVDPCTTVLVSPPY